MPNWTQQLREAYYKLRESRAISDMELRTLSSEGSAGGMAGAVRNVNRIRAVVDRIDQKAQQPGADIKKLEYDTERAKHMLGALGVETFTRRSGMGLKIPQRDGRGDLLPDTPHRAVTKDTWLPIGTNDIMSREHSAKIANRMMKDRRIQ